MFSIYNCIILCDRELYICLCQGIYFISYNYLVVTLITNVWKIRNKWSLDLREECPTGLNEILTTCSYIKGVLHVEY